MTLPELRSTGLPNDRQKKHPKSVSCTHMVHCDLPCGGRLPFILPYRQIIQVLENAGGILIAKTNVPQTMLSFECCNPVWGRTLHPLSVSTPTKSKTSKKIPLEEVIHPFTSGGSSGGESALIACDGSALGLGTDIGGSLRIPTSWCGVYALKPTPGRTSGHGQAGEPSLHCDLNG